MKIPSVGWAFFGLSVAILVGNVLNRGLYVGSEIEDTTLALNNGKVIPYYKKYCSYLYLNGVQESWSRLSEQIPRVDKWSLCRD